MERRRGYWDGTEVVPTGRDEGGNLKPKKQRAVPMIDPEIQNADHPNDFDRWMSEQREARRMQNA
jgi:hypothetical protein